jgi:hypothetical protein
MRAAPLVIALAACSAGAPEQPAAVHAANETAAPTCRPLVSGCGCAYACAEGFEETSPKRWRVIHDGLDSTTIDAVLQDWCFDEAGHGFPVHAINTPPPTDRRCIEVFYDQSPCGGECIPTTEHLGCAAAGDRCASRSP